MSSGFIEIHEVRNDITEVLGGVDLDLTGTLSDVRKLCVEELGDLLPSDFAFLRGGRIRVGKLQEQKTTVQICVREGQLFIKSNKSNKPVAASFSTENPTTSDRLPEKSEEESLEPGHSKRKCQKSIASYFQNKVNDVPTVNAATGKVKLYSQKEIDGTVDEMERQRMMFHNKKADELCSDRNTSKSIVTSAARLRRAINSAWFVKKFELQKQKFDQLMKERETLLRNNPVVANKIKLATKTQKERALKNLSKATDFKGNLKQINNDLFSLNAKIRASCGERRNTYLKEKQEKESELMSYLV